MGSIFVIRHGQSADNARAVIQGPRMDGDLSDLGRRQAAALGAAFAETRLDAVFVSPMRRARDTAEGMLHDRVGHVAAQVVPELYELDFGLLCGHPLDDVRDEVGQIMDAWTMGFVDQAFPGGESPVLAQHRIRGFADRVHDRAMDEDVAVVAHGRINRILVSTLVGAGLTAMARFPQANANITHLEVDGAAARPQRVNDTSHLRDTDVT